MSLKAVGILSVVMLTGCAASTAQNHPRLASRSDAMRVRSSSYLWRERLSFGDFKVALSSGIPWERVSGDLARTGLVGQRHRFAVTDTDSKIEASCTTRQSGEPWISAARRPPVVDCSFQEPEGGQQWLFSVERTGLKRFAGSLRAADGAAEIRVASENAGEAPNRDLTDPLGYTVTRGGAVIAEVGTKGGRRVWIEAALPQPERLRAAAIAAALLLFDPLEDDRR